MGIASLPLRAAPDEAAILLGFGAGEDRATAVRTLHRLIADCGRYGFARTHVLHPPDWSHVVGEALATLPALSPLPALAAQPATSALAGLSARAGHCADRIMALSGPALVEANWLDLLDHHHPSEAGAIGLMAPDGSRQTGEGAGAAAPFGLSAGLATPLAPGAAPHRFCGLAVLACAALRAGRDAREITRETAGGGMDDFSAFLARLAAGRRLGGWEVPAGAILSPSATLPLRAVRPALFLDRDGTLNQDYGYVSDPARIVLLPGAARTVRRANDLGFYVFLVTNQSGVGRGYYREEDVHACNAALQRLLRAEGAHLDDIRYAIDHPDAASPHRRGDGGWRKPEPGMLLDLMAHWPVDRARSLMVGDKASDVEAGRAAGIASVRFEGGDLDALLAPRLAERATPGRAGDMAPHFCP